MKELLQLFFALIVVGLIIQIPYQIVVAVGRTGPIGYCIISVVSVFAIVLSAVFTVNKWKSMGRDTKAGLGILAAVVCTGLIWGLVEAPTSWSPRGLQAYDLAREYYDDFGHANLKYLNKTVTIIGVVEWAAFDAVTNEPFVVLGPAPPGSRGVMCTFPYEERERIARLERGQKIKVRGRVNGYLPLAGYEVVDVIDCRLLWVWK